MPHSQELVHLFWQIQKAIHEKMRDAGSEIPFTMSEVLVIKAIMCQNINTVSLMANYMNIRKASASSLIKRLEEKGYIKRLANKEDKRSQLLKPTPKAEKTMAKMTTFFSKHATIVFDNVSKKEQKQLQKLLMKIVEGEAKNEK